MMSKQRIQRIAYLEHNLRAKAWHDFLNRIGYSHTNPNFATFTALIQSTIPPTYIHTDDDRWEHLRQIAASHVTIPGCGLICRGKLTQFLRKNDPEGD